MSCKRKKKNLFPILIIAFSFGLVAALLVSTEFVAVVLGILLIVLSFMLLKS